METFTDGDLSILRTLITREKMRGALSERGQKTHLGVRLDTGYRAAVDDYAERNGVSVSETLRRAIAVFLGGE